MYRPNWGMTGCSRGQGVPLHRGLQQGAPANSNKLRYRFITVACTGLFAQPSWFALERWLWLTFLYNYLKVLA